MLKINCIYESFDTDISLIFHLLAAQIEEVSLLQTPVESTIELEDETTKTRAARRKRAVEPVKVEVPRESPEEIAARERKAAAEKAMYMAILLIQNHERARRARVRGKDGN